MHRRTFLGLLGGLVTAQWVGASNEQPIRIGLTPVILDNRIGFLRNWAHWLEGELQHPVEFTQRAKYQDIMDLLERAQLDAAWICGYPYVRNMDTLELLAVPLYRGKPLYRSYIITHAHNKEIKEFSDMRGKVFAFSDPLSNSGYLYPIYRLHQLFPSESQPQRKLFRRTFFTWGHRHVIEAVATGLADAGAVDGYVWDQLSRLHPELTSQTRIVEKSPEFGFPPLVTTKGLSAERRNALALAFGRMHEDPRGRELLNSLGLDGFAFRTPKLFAGIALMASSVGDELDQGK